LLDARAYLPALRERFGIDGQRTKQWITMGALALAMASGDFGAAGGIKEDLDRLLRQIDSIVDLGLSVELGAMGVVLRLYATGQGGGALHTWIRTRRSHPLALHQRIEPGAAVALALARPVQKDDATEPSTEPSKGAGKTSKEAAQTHPGKRRSILTPLVEFLLKKLPDAYQTPVRRLWQALTGPNAGEVALALGYPGNGALSFDLLLQSRRPAEARQEMFESALGILTALGETLSPQGATPGLTDSGGRSDDSGSVSQKMSGSTRPPFELKTHREPAMDRIDLLPAQNPVLQAALTLLLGDASISLAVTHRDDHVALCLSPKAETRAKTLLDSVAPRGSEAHAPHILGRLAFSLVELSRLLPGLWPEGAPKPRDAGAMLLHWGTVPSLRRVELVISLPSAHLKALAPLLQGVSDRLERSTSSLAALLGLPDEAKDAL